MNTRSHETINAIEQQLGIPGKYGAWWTARRLLREVWKDKPIVIRDATFDLRELPFTQATSDILWRLDQLDPAMIGQWVHHFDKNSQYLSACRSVYTGVGDPIHADNPTGLKFPGIYRVTWDSGTSVFDGIRYPWIFDVNDEWVTQELLAFAIKQGYRMHIYEAWVFPDHARILEEWAMRLWHARSVLRGINEEAAQEINNIAHVGPGAFATNAGVHPGIDLIHPNWWCDVVGAARVRMLANLLKYGPSVCIRTDALYYITHEQDIRKAVPGILDRETESGGYKVPRGWQSLQLTQEIYEQSTGLNHGELSSLFKKYGGMK